MPYEHFQSSVNPRLLILLTDELEESVRVVNKIIDQQIQLNFDGNAPKNRCFISVIGYKQNVKELCSGWLKDLDASPLSYQTYKKKLIVEAPDGVGGFFKKEEEIVMKLPVWIETSSKQPSFISYADSIKLAIELACLWSEDNVMSPIVIDISKECHANQATKEIEKLKSITTVDGNMLFFGSFSEDVDDSVSIYSNMPEEWKWRFYQWDLNNIFFRNGILHREKLFSIIDAITYTGGLPSNFNGFTI